MEYFLYAIIFVLLIYIIINIKNTGKVSVSDAIALLGIVVAILLAVQLQPSSPTGPTATAEVSASTETPNWAITFEYRFPAGFWFVGTHEYTIKSDCPNIEDGSGIWTNIFFVSESEQLFSGDVYLRLGGLKYGPQNPSEALDVEKIHPMQTTTAAMNITEITKADAEQALTNCNITIEWDGGTPNQMTPGAPFQQ